MAYTQPGNTPLHKAKGGGTRKIKKSKNWNPSKSFLHHKFRISKFYKQKDDFYAKRKFYRLFFQDDMNLYKTIMKEVRKLGQYNQTTILWILSH